MLKDHPVLSVSFRPFFLLAALIATINPTLWASIYLGRFNLALNSDPLYWHGHEMLFGFTGALIAGFLFTASAHWTNTRPYQGKALLLLVAMWIVERMSFFLPVPKEIYFLLSNIFLPTVLVFAVNKLKNHRKQLIPFSAILTGMTLSKLIYSFGNTYEFYEWESFGKMMGVGILRILILLIAGRVLPFFTMKKIGDVQIDVPKFIQILSIATLLPLVFKDCPPVFYFFAFIVNFSRQIFWRPWLSFKIPILFVLNLGVFLINVELFIEWFNSFNDSFSFAQSALHLFLAGGLGVVAIGIMTRVSLGHTGRNIHANNWTLVAYSFILIGAMIRFVIPVLFPENFLSSIHFASGFWTSGFLIFLIVYGKILWTKRVDA